MAFDPATARPLAAGGSGGPAFDPGTAQPLEPDEISTPIRNKDGAIIGADINGRKHYWPTPSLSGKIARTATFGIADKAANAVRALGDNVTTGAPIRPTMGALRSAEDRAYKEFDARHPIQGALGAAGGLAVSGGVGAPEALAGTLVGRTAQRVGLGTGYGAATAFGQATGTPQEQAEQTAAGAGIGAVAAPVAGAVGEGAVKTGKWVFHVAERLFGGNVAGAMAAAAQHMAEVGLGPSDRELAAKYTLHMLGKEPMSPEMQARWEALLAKNFQAKQVATELAAQVGRAGGILGQDLRRRGQPGAFDPTTAQPHTPGPQSSLGGALREIGGIQPASGAELPGGVTPATKQLPNTALVSDEERKNRYGVMGSAEDLQRSEDARRNGVFNNTPQGQVSQGIADTAVGGARALYDLPGKVDDNTVLRDRGWKGLAAGAVDLGSQLAPLALGKVRPGVPLPRAALELRARAMKGLPVPADALAPGNLALQVSALDNRIEMMRAKISVMGKDDPSRQALNRQRLDLISERNRLDDLQRATAKARVAEWDRRDAEAAGLGNEKKTLLLDPPNVPQRPFEADYPFGAPADETGRLTHDTQGDPLVGNIIVGRRVAGGPDEALSPKKFNALAKKLTGSDTEIISASEAGRGTYGLTLLDRNTGKPLGIEISNGTPPKELAKVYGHEISHVIDELAGQISTEGLEGEFRLLYHDLTPPEAINKTRIFGPEMRGYHGEEVKRELAAEAVRASITNPNYMKTTYPEIYAGIRDAVKRNPELVKQIQFNTVAGTVGLGTFMQMRDKGSGAGKPPLLTALPAKLAAGLAQKIADKTQGPPGAAPSSPDLRVFTPAGQFSNGEIVGPPKGNRLSRFVDSETASGRALLKKGDEVFSPDRGEWAGRALDQMGKTAREEIATAGDAVRSARQWVGDRVVDAGHAIQPDGNVVLQRAIERLPSGTPANMEDIADATKERVLKPADTTIPLRLYQARDPQIDIQYYAHNGLNFDTALKIVVHDFPDRKISEGTLRQEHKDAFKYSPARPDGKLNEADVAGHDSLGRVPEGYELQRNLPQTGARGFQVVPTDSTIKEIEREKPPGPQSNLFERALGIQPAYGETPNTIIIDGKPVQVVPHDPSLPHGTIYAHEPPKSYTQNKDWGATYKNYPVDEYLKTPWDKSIQPEARKWHEANDAAFARHLPEVQKELAGQDVTKDDIRREAQRRANTETGPFDYGPRERVSEDGYWGKPFVMPPDAADGEEDMRRIWARGRQRAGRIRNMDQGRGTNNYERRTDAPDPRSDPLAGRQIAQADTGTMNDAVPYGINTQGVPVNANEDIIKGNPAPKFADPYGEPSLHSEEERRALIGEKTFQENALPPVGNIPTLVVAGQHLHDLLSQQSEGKNVAPKDLGDAKFMLAMALLSFTPAGKGASGAISKEMRSFMDAPIAQRAAALTAKAGELQKAGRLDDALMAKWLSTNMDEARAKIVRQRGSWRNAAETLPKTIEQSALANAKAKGFDTENIYWHGAGEVWKSDMPRVTDGGTYGSGFYMTSDPLATQHYATKGLLPLALKADAKVLDIDKMSLSQATDLASKLMPGERLPNAHYQDRLAELLREKDYSKKIRAMGYDVLTVDGETIVFDPSKAIRLSSTPAKPPTPSIPPDAVLEPGIMGALKRMAGKGAPDVPLTDAARLDFRTALLNGKLPEYQYAQDMARHEAIVDGEKIHDLLPNQKLKLAEDAGYDSDTLFFHGTGRGQQEQGGAATGKWKSGVPKLTPYGDWGKGFYVSRRPSIAAGYAKTNQGAAVMPLVLRKDAKVLRLDNLDDARAKALIKEIGLEEEAGASLNKPLPLGVSLSPVVALKYALHAYAPEGAEKIARAAKIYDKLRAAGYDAVDPGGEQFIVLNPVKLRHIDAGFDPAKRGSSDIFSQNGPPPRTLGLRDFSNMAMRGEPVPLSAAA